MQFGLIPYRAKVVLQPFLSTEIDTSPPSLLLWPDLGKNHTVTFLVYGN